MAERVGFEPTVRFDTYTCFPSKRLRPLGHLSVIWDFSAIPSVRHGPRSVAYCRGRTQYPQGELYDRCDSLLKYRGPRVGSLATISCEPRQARKGAAAAV